MNYSVTLVFLLVLMFKIFVVTSQFPIFDYPITDSCIQTFFSILFYFAGLMVEFVHIFDVFWPCVHDNTWMNLLLHDDQLNHLQHDLAISYSRFFERVLRHVFICFIRMWLEP